MGTWGMVGGGEGATQAYKFGSCISGNLIGWWEISERWEIEKVNKQNKKEKVKTENGNGGP